MQLDHFLSAAAQRHSDKLAVVCRQRRATYGEIETLANRLAHGWIQQGADRGDRVAIYLDNSVEFVVSMFAALKAGLVFMPIGATTKIDKLIYILNNSRARTLVTDGRKSAALLAAGDRVPHLRSLVITDPVESQAESESFSVQSLASLIAPNRSFDYPPPERAIDIDLAALIYTSGSTGNPKGVMLTHLNMVSAATSINTYLENTANDVILNVLPLSFDYGLYQVLLAFQVGATVVIERSFTYPHAVLQQIQAERVTGLPIVPTIAAILLQIDLRRYDLATLRYVTNTAAALPVEHILRLRQLLPGVRLFSMYGLTECKRVSYLPPEQLDIRPGSVGRGMPNEEVYLVDDQGNRLGPNQVGELVVRGSNVMKGYWELPEETDRMLKPGSLPGEKVLYTGDLFRTDSEGYLYFVGRKDDIIKTRGEKVSPKEVENVLHSLPGVAEAAVIGVPDPVLGQAIQAMVTVKAGAVLTHQEVLRHCRKHLEDFMVPQHVEFREALPKTPNGKINKRALCGAEA